MDEVRFLIVGAGPTGLGAGWALSEAGETDWLIVEAESQAGGLAGSYVDEHGFTWDFGGHVQFSHYDYFDALMDSLLGADGWLEHERQAWVWMHGRFIPYPLQHNLHRLPEPLATRCLNDLIKAQGHQSTPPENFEHWLNQQFGGALMDAFLRPYNEKVWAWPLSDMNATWVGERVATVNAETLREDFAARRDAVRWGPNRTFKFPQQGGTGAVWRALSRRLSATHPGQLQFSMPLRQLDIEKRRVHLSDGRTIHYGELLSTIPVTELIARANTSPQLRDAASQLGYSTTHLVGVALHGAPGENLADKSWMYFPEPEIPFYRMTVFSNYAPANVPKPGEQWSLLTETAASPHRPVQVDQLNRRVVQALLSNGFIETAAQVHHVWHRTLPYGYPTPTLERDTALERLLPDLESYGVYSRGRFGAWKYEISNQDHSLAQGVELAGRWLRNAPETTLTFNR